MKFIITISLIFILASCKSKSVYYETIHSGSYGTVELTKKKELIFLLSGNTYLPKDNHSIRAVCIYCRDCYVENEKKKKSVESITLSLHNCKVIQITSSGKMGPSSQLPFMLDKIKLSDLDRVPVVLSYAIAPAGTLFLSTNTIELLKKIKAGTDYNKYGFFTLPNNIEQVDSIRYRYHPAVVKTYMQKYNWDGSSKKRAR